MESYHGSIYIKRDRCGLLLQSISLVLLVLFSCCSIDDYRDICCEDVTLDYRYIRQNSDLFSYHIRSMRHFLFDASGLFMYEIPPNETNKQRLILKNLLPGSYTVITVGNMAENTEQ